MPINRDTPPTLANQATDALAEKTASVLIRHAEGQLQELMSLQKKIGERQSSLVILMKRFYIEHSYFDKASDAYGNTSTFGKVAYTATFIGMSTLMGAALNLAALFALVSIAIAYLTSVLLSNHHTISFARSARLEADIIEMEETNKAQFEEFSLLEDKLNEALVNLNYTHVRLPEDALSFETQLHNLKTQITNLTTNITLLETTNTALIGTKKNLTEQLDFIHLALTEAEAQLKQRTDGLGDTESSISALGVRLSKICDDLEEVHRVYQENLTADDEALEGVIIDNASVSEPSIDNASRDLEMEALFAQAKIQLRKSEEYRARAQAPRCTGPRGAL